MADIRYSHAEGLHSVAGEMASHAEGFTTYASGRYSHAEGQETEARGEVSRATGYRTLAKASKSEAHGQNAAADHDGSYVWNGIANAQYHSNGAGTFSINPVDGISGFYIAGQPLATYI